MPRRVVLVAVAIALSAPLTACSSSQPAAAVPLTSDAGSAAGASGTPSASPPPSATPSQTAIAAVSPTPPGSTPACTDSTLGAVETRHDAEGSRMSSLVKVVNGSRRACVLSGYPRPAFWASTGYKLVKIPLAVSHGATAAAKDPGATRFLVPPGGTAWFSVGTGTTPGGHYRALTYFTFYPTAKTSGVGVLCGVNLATTSQDPVRVTVTAFAPGPPPPA
jgi:hypothetical protein